MLKRQSGRTCSMCAMSTYANKGNLCQHCGKFFCSDCSDSFLIMSPEENYRRTTFAEVMSGEEITEVHYPAMNCSECTAEEHPVLANALKPKADSIESFINDILVPLALEKLNTPKADVMSNHADFIEVQETFDGFRREGFQVIPDYTNLARLSPMKTYNALHMSRPDANAWKKELRSLYEDGKVGEAYVRNQLKMMKMPEPPLPKDLVDYFTYTEDVFELVDEAVLLLLENNRPMTVEEGSLLISSAYQRIKGKSTSSMQEAVEELSIKTATDITGEQFVLLEERLHDLVGNTRIESALYLQSMMEETDKFWLK